MFRMIGMFRLVRLFRDAGTLFSAAWTTSRKRESFRVWVLFLDLAQRFQWRLAKKHMSMAFSEKNIWRSQSQRRLGWFETEGRGLPQLGSRQACRSWCGVMEGCLESAQKGRKGQPFNPFCL